MGCCLSGGREHHSSYERLQDGHLYNAMNSTQNHVWMAQSTAEQRETICMDSSARERELMRELELTRKELEKEKQKLQLSEMEREETISSIEKEVIEYRKQLEMVRRQLERENSEWEAMTNRLEMELETEKLKVEARDAELHRLALAKDQEMGQQMNYLEFVKSELESENKALKEEIQGITVGAAEKSRETPLL